jgi:mRNA interferase RelE/StbE
LIWEIEWDERARKELRSLDKGIQRRIFSYLRERTTENPRNFGKQLSGNMAGLWRYRIEDFRVICRLEDEKLTVVVVAVGHRKEIYD